MGERKVLNKYFPPDFDPAKLPRGKRRETNEMKVRMMLPMSVRCKTCGLFMYKGTKFNTRKEDVMSENYLGIQVYRFYWRCKKCSAEFCMKTDPKNADYVLEAGATRNYEPWRDEDATKSEAVARRDEEEMGNAMKALENRTLDSKREMDIMAALDEMKALNAQHAKVTTEQALQALQRAAAQQQLDEGDALDVAEFYQLRAQEHTRRLSDSSGDDGALADAAAVGGRAGPSSSRVRNVLRSAEPGPDLEKGPSLGPEPSNISQVQPQIVARTGSGHTAPQQHTQPAPKSLIKVKVKPKVPPPSNVAISEQLTEAATAHGTLCGSESAAGKRPASEITGDDEDAAKKPKFAPALQECSFLPGLLGQYGSSGSESEQ